MAVGDVEVAGGRGANRSLAPRSACTPGARGRERIAPSAITDLALRMVAAKMTSALGRARARHDPVASLGARVSAPADRGARAVWPGDVLRSHGAGVSRGGGEIDSRSQRRDESSSATSESRSIGLATGGRGVTARLGRIRIESRCIETHVGFSRSPVRTGDAVVGDIEPRNAASESRTIELATPTESRCIELATSKTASSAVVGRRLAHVAGRGLCGHPRVSERAVVKPTWVSSSTSVVGHEKTTRSGADPLIAKLPS